MSHEACRTHTAKMLLLHFAKENQGIVTKLSNDLKEGLLSGHNHFQHKLNNWLQMQRLAIMLAFVEEKLVVPQVRFIVDERQTFIRQGMRFVPELQGRELLGSLRR